MCGRCIREGQEKKKGLRTLSSVLVSTTTWAERSWAIILQLTTVHRYKRNLDLHANVSWVTLRPVPSQAFREPPCWCKWEFKWADVVMLTLEKMLGIITFSFLVHLCSCLPYKWLKYPFVCVLNYSWVTKNYLNYIALDMFWQIRKRF